MRKIPKRDPSADFVREAIAQRRNAGKKCKCGEMRPQAFASRKAKSCVECEREKRGRITTDNHHLAGKANSSVTIQVKANDHRARLSLDQCDWPKATLENRDGCPLLAAAGCVRGFVDYIYFAIDKYLLWIPEMLETLSEFLAVKLGAKWWHNTCLDRFSPKHRRNVVP